MFCPAAVTMTPPSRNSSEDLAGLLAHKEATTGLALVDQFRDMLAGAKSHELRKNYGDSRARHAGTIIIKTIGDYARSSGNLPLQHLLARFTGAEEEPAPALRKSASAPLAPQKERDYGSIASIVARFDKPVGSAVLGKYRRRWLDYPPRSASSGYRNRMEEVLAGMVQDGVLRALKTRTGAAVYEPGPQFDKYQGR